MTASTRPSVTPPTPRPPRPPAAGNLRAGGLQRRLQAVVLAGALVSACVAGAIAYRIDYQRTLEAGRAQVVALLEAVSKTAAIGAYAGDRVLVQEVVQGIAGNRLVAGTQVRDASGQVLGSSPEPAGTEGAAVSLSHEDDEQAFAVEQPLISPFDPAQRIGTLAVRIEASQLKDTARLSASVPALMIMAQTVVVSVLLYLAAASLVSRPIVHLAHDLRHMPAGTTARLTTPPAHARDEIGDLIAGANALLAANEAALQLERELRNAIEQMEAQYRQIFDTSSAGIFVLDSKGRLINGNPTVMRLTGRSVDEIRKLSSEAFVQATFANPDQVRQMIGYASERSETISADLELMRADGRPCWVHCLISVQGMPVGKALVEGVMYDVTERKRQEAEVRHRAEHDPLTGLMNRAALESRLDRLLTAATAAGRPVSVMYLDLDGFKRINDAFGHEAGDRVLVECARRIRAATRREGSDDGDVVARIGGDEFVIGLDAIGPDDADLSGIADRIIEGVQRPITLVDGTQVFVGTSVGIACAPRHGNGHRRLLQCADTVLYEVKRNGKNAYAVALAPPEQSGKQSVAPLLAPDRQTSLA